MNAEKGTLLGLGTILAAAAILVVGYWTIWDRDYFFYRPLLQSHPSLSFEEARALFDGYAQENANVHKEFADRHRLNLTKAVNASTTKDRKELLAIVAERSEGMPGVFLPTNETPLEEVRARAIGGLAAESRQLSNSEVAENSALVTKYRQIMGEKASAEEARQRHQQGWVLSLLSSTIVLIIAGVVAFFGLRLLRRSARPGTVFDSTAQK